MSVDSEFLEKEYGDKIPRRKEEFIKAIELFSSEFKKKHPTKELALSIDGVATDLAYLYFHWSYTLVKPFVNKLSDRYKIASNTEFTIVRLQPLHVIDGSKADSLVINATFAFYMALNIILNFDSESDGAKKYSSAILSFKGGIAPLEDAMDKIIDNHRRYITNFNFQIESPPIILNGFVWEMIDMFYKFQWQSLAI